MQRTRPCKGRKKIIDHHLSLPSLIFKKKKRNWKTFISIKKEKRGKPKSHSLNFFIMLLLRKRRQKWRFCKFVSFSISEEQAKEFDTNSQCLSTFFWEYWKITPQSSVLKLENWCLFLLRKIMRKFSKQRKIC